MSWFPHFSRNVRFLNIFDQFYLKIEGAESGIVFRTLGLEKNLFVGDDLSTNFGVLNRKPRENVFAYT